MKCPACSQEIPGDAKFCQFCGNQMVYDAERKKAPKPTATSTSVEKMLGREHAPQADHSQLTHDPVTGLPEDLTLWDGRFSPLAMYSWWFLGGLVTILTVIGLIWKEGDSRAWLIGLGCIATLWLGLMIFYWYRRSIVHYKLTRLRFFIERGILFKNIDRIDIMHLDKTDFTQGPFERIFKVGNLVIDSETAEIPQITLRGIANLRGVADLIDKARLAERERRGIDIGAARQAPMPQRYESSGEARDSKDD